MSYRVLVLSKILAAALRSAAALGLAASTTGARADISVQVDISEQIMRVKRDDKDIYEWSVSTGSPQHETPIGTFRPVRMHQEWRSIKYDGVPMPNSIFFFRGYAIHGTLDTRDLGRPASRGCIRLHPENAKVLFDLVSEQGMSRTRITIED